MSDTFWTCPANRQHLLGVVRRHAGRKRLYLYRQAQVTPGVDAEIAGEAIGGYVAYCSICGARRRWYDDETMSPARVELARIAFK